MYLCIKKFPKNSVKGRSPRTQEVCAATGEQPLPTENQCWPNSTTCSPHKLIPKLIINPEFQPRTSTQLDNTRHIRNHSKINFATRWQHQQKSLDFLIFLYFHKVSYFRKYYENNSNFLYTNKIHINVCQNSKLSLYCKQIYVKTTNISL